MPTLDDFQLLILVALPVVNGDIDELLACHPTEIEIVSLS
jgi:hypothetical protein